MSSNAWIFQRPEQVRDMGEQKAPWYVGWYDLDGRRHKQSCGTGFQGQKKAERLRNKIDNELMTGTYELQVKKPWADFRQEYREKIIPRLAVRSRPEVETSLEHFERIVKPVRVFAITTSHIDDFIKVRRQEPGKKKGATVSPATVNKDLRHIKAALGVAVEWHYLRTLPKFRMEKEPKRLPTFISGEHFAAVYAACEEARMPNTLPYPAADWWRGLLVMAYMTGWRISDLLGLRRDDLDLDAGQAITRFEDNKGKRDERVKLHPVVVEHLRRLPGFTSTVFPWMYNRTTLDKEFARIQRSARVELPDGSYRIGIHLPCPERHEHTPACHVYGFHDLRRAFATMNADRLTGDALQSLMRHKSYLTTQVCINLAKQVDEAVEKLHVPDVLKVRKAEGE